MVSTLSISGQLGREARRSERRVETEGANVTVIVSGMSVAGIAVKENRVKVAVREGAPGEMIAVGVVGMREEKIVGKGFRREGAAAGKRTGAALVAGRKRRRPRGLPLK